MKTLKTTDLFAALRVISTAGLREKLKPLLVKASKGDKLDIDDVGVDAALAILEGVSAAGTETALYEFLSRPWEMTAEEIAELDLKAFKAKFKEMAEVNDLTAFFGDVAKSITKK